MNTNPKVDFYFNKAKKWQEEVAKLRTLILNCGLNEELKWGCPCYTLKSSKPGNPASNIVLIHDFKEYCALLFFKGALLDNSHGILIQQTENVQAARQIRFTNLEDIAKLESVVKAHIYEAIEVEKGGLEVDLKKTEEFNMPEEFQKILNEDPALKTAFETLTPGRQRGYLLHFSAPTQSKTRLARVEKCAPLIFEGKGYNER